MAKKTPTPEDHLDAPAGESVEPAPAPAPKPALTDNSASDEKWPESTERRSLVVAFDEADKSKIMDKVADLVSEKEALKSEAKSEASRLKGLIDDIDAKISRWSSSVRRGGEEQPVMCFWRFECSGLDDAGGPIYQPQYKTLFRGDTRQAVTTALITDEDRQMNLDGVPADEYAAGEDDDDSSEDEEGEESEEDDLTAAPL